MKAESTFQPSLYLGLGTAIATFVAAAVALGLLTPVSLRARLVSVGVVQSATIGISASFITVAQQQATAVGHVAIAIGLLLPATYVLVKALASIFEDREEDEADLDGLTVSPPVGSASITCRPARGERSRRGLLLAGASIGTSVLVLIALTLPDLGDRIVSPQKEVVISNLVTSGLNLREDSLPVTLTSEPVVFCRSRPGCRELQGTSRRTNGVYRSPICQTEGDLATNGNSAASDDDRNPQLAASRRYYRIRLPDGRTGYVSEVWLRPADRGGLGLPRCADVA
jgi:hypothetical protein